MASPPTTSPQPDRAAESSEQAVIVGDPWPALREFAGIAAVFCALWLIPYAHPSMENYRYFEQLDASPLLRAITFQQPPSAEQVTLPGLGSAATSAKLSPEEEEAALAALDPTISTRAAIPPTAPQARLAPPPPPRAPATDAGVAGAKPGAHGAKAAAALPAVSTAQPNTAQPIAALQITDATIGKPRAWIVHPERMNVFWRSLVALAHDHQKHVRVRHYGDSHLANDGISHVLRVLLQRRFGDGGHGFLLAASRTQWYHRKGVRWTSNSQWKPRNFLGGGLRDGAYGYGGVAAIGRAGAMFRVRTTKHGPGSRANRFELSWRGVATGALQVRIDGKTEVVKLAKDGRDAYRSWDLADAPHDIRVRVTRGRARIFGAVLERNVGVTYDSLGVVGARARRWLNAKVDHMHEQIAHRPAQLVVFNYGGNSRNDRISASRYIDRYLKVIARLRLGTKEACLIIGPTDHGKKKHGKIISEPNTIRMIGWQRQIADAAGCGFLDARALMGGDGSMGRWVKRGLGWADYGHLTPKGQRTLGKAIYGTWMAGLRSYVGTHARTDPNMDNSAQLRGESFSKRAAPACGGKAQLAGLGRAQTQ